METVQSVDPDSIPFLLKEDLIVFKIYCCGLRFESKKGFQDEADVRKLLAIGGRTGIALDDMRRQAILSGLTTFVCKSRYPRTWWEAHFDI